jgi:membrane-bound lytic murein transglycosylase B
MGQRLMNRGEPAMSTPRFGRVQKATAFVPLALLSIAWTASLAGVGVTTASAGQSLSAPTTSLPDGTTVPNEAIEAPASVSVPGRVAPAITGNKKRVVANASTSGIPSAALAAYQRAETVINAADKSCNLSWQLVAAIGRVESDHGRTNGNSLDQDGVAQPGIYGIALDGTNNTAVIRDTDGGQYDSDDQFDRAVGPMQFIPSTWSVVGVDSDGDAQRNPQDIDDAALATAVYLCSGDDDLSTTPGQRAAVHRYNHSESYVNLVLSIMNAYMDGDFTSVPNGTTSAPFIAPEPQPQSKPTRTPQVTQPNGGGTNNGGNPPADPNPAPPAPNNPPPSAPVQNPPPPTHPAGGVTNPPNPPAPPPLPPLPAPEIPPVDEVLTQAQAAVQCTEEGYSALTDKAAWDKCIAGYTN